MEEGEEEEDEEEEEGEEGGGNVKDQVSLRSLRGIYHWQLPAGCYQARVQAAVVTDSATLCTCNFTHRACCVHARVYN